MFIKNYLTTNYLKPHWDVFWEKHVKFYWKMYFSPTKTEYHFTYKQLFLDAYVDVILENFWKWKISLHNNHILFRYFILNLIDRKVFWLFMQDYAYYSQHKDFNDAKNRYIRKVYFWYIFPIGRFTKKIKNLKHFYDQHIWGLKLVARVILFNVKWILLAAIIAGLYFVISLFFIQIEFTKQLGVWYMLMVSYYLLMSTFNSFVSKYRYGKFTTGIQRFWKRTGIIFWILEGFLFILFFYYFLNSSQEPLYMFDYANLNQEYLLQLRISYRSMMWLTFIIFLCFILNLNLNSKTYYQNILLLTFISLCIFYTLYIEAYQFVYILNLTKHRMWTFDDNDQTWSLENEQNNIRPKQLYFILCLVGKYWHFIFIFISWFFFFVKSMEVRKINITLLGYNTQNIIILYWLNLICLIQWVKVFYKKFFELSYSWFNFQFDENFFAIFSLEFWYTMMTFFTIDYDVTLIKHLIITSQSVFLSNELSLWKYI